MRHVPIDLDWRRLGWSVALPFGGLALLWGLRQAPGSFFYPMAITVIGGMLWCTKQLGVTNLALRRKKELAEHAA